MKRIFIILGLALAFAACNGNKSNNSTDTTTTTTTTTSASSSTTTVKDTVGKALIAKNDCLTCHKLDQKIVGPAYQDVANKYTASADVIDTLANKVIKGGSGNWGSVPMSAHPDLSMDDAREMIKYILSLKK
ncbi:c-type cytochrome [Mucilaginibacter sp. X5P1]|uniref:c-type cytochrome n=1 Tax=Mucilaginibacter sp. X5P1 TaxID=2723088 RepID=UPI00160BF2FC|nr:c-type cytochrome [Mucilaginibacter sp. X5P1]MBB6138115.1 cytochrome c [Mucilaginibacter sp. X5P1]